MKDVSELSDESICSVLNAGYNGNVKYWKAAESEAHRRKIYFKEYDKPKRSFDWMIFLMCLGFAISFILGYLACLIRSL